MTTDWMLGQFEQMRGQASKLTVILCGNYRLGTVGVKNKGLTTFFAYLHIVTHLPEHLTNSNFKLFQIMVADIINFLSINIKILV